MAHGHGQWCEDGSMAECKGENFGKTNRIIKKRNGKNDINRNLNSEELEDEAEISQKIRV